MNLQEEIEQEYEDVREISHKKIKNPSSNVNILVEKCEEFFAETTSRETSRVRSESSAYLPDHLYNQAKKITEKIERIIFKKEKKDKKKKKIYATEDITQFSFQLEQFIEKEHFSEIGIFISALINHHHNELVEFEYKREKKNEPYLIHTASYPKLIDYLGYHNSFLSMRIIGNAGNYAARSMYSGSVFIEGNAKDFAGQTMEGGVLVIEQANDYLGYNMGGGDIYVINAGKNVGQNMMNGTIRIRETYESIGKRTTQFSDNGKIYYKKYLQE